VYAPKCHKKARTETSLLTRAFLVCGGINVCQKFVDSLPATLLDCEVLQCPRLASIGVSIRDDRIEGGAPSILPSSCGIHAGTVKLTERWVISAIRGHVEDCP
jgi:hypothetical protein